MVSGPVPRLMVVIVPRGIILLTPERTQMALMSSGLRRNFGSACTYTRYVRPKRVNGLMYNLARHEVGGGLIASQHGVGHLKLGLQHVVASERALIEPQRDVVEGLARRLEVEGGDTAVRLCPQSLEIGRLQVEQQQAPHALHLLHRSADLDEGGGDLILQPPKRGQQLRQGGLRLVSQALAERDLRRDVRSAGRHQVRGLRRGLRARPIAGVC